ncbi:ankyrin repeat-containing domain protein [Flagelloscypha sp. PMI_526]|nr:ankyrin repeat-containing domain protein [Flagelloscypha sp. PMI_526]
MLILAHSLVWLFKLSNNVATQRIVTATLYGCLVEYWNLPLNNLTWRLRMLVGMPSLITFLEATLQSSMVKIAFEILIDQVHERVPHDDHTKSSPGVWIGVLDVVFHCSKIPSGALPAPITRDELNRELSILMYAGMRQVDLKDPLLRWGADINYCGHNGDGFLHDAIRANNLDTVQCLIDHHCQIDEPVMEGASFRGGASSPSKWNPDIVTFLLENGAHINETFPLEGRTSTPLQFAAEIGKPEAVRFLLEKGAVLSSKIKDTIHRLDWIGSSNSRTTRAYISEIERMLLEHASRVIEPQFRELLR